MADTESDKKELANFLDTEGFIGIVCSKDHGHERFIPSVMLSNTERGWLERVKAKWGGTISPVKKQTKEWYSVRMKHLELTSQGWCWHIHGDRLLAVLDAVIPYLTIKADPAALCRELQYRISKRIGIDTFHRLTQQEREFRTELHRKCKLMTSRGPKSGEQLVLPKQTPQLLLPI